MNSQKATSFTHLDESGQARMVDVSDKPVTLRQATAAGSIFLGEKIFPLLVDGQLTKGDALATARLAAIMAAKNTPNLIPLCHGIPLSGIDIEFIPHPDRLAIEIKVTVRGRAQTGVEMEALTGVATAALTIYDMCKAVDKNMTIDDIHLVKKSGGKSGDYHYCPKK